MRVEATIASKDIQDKLTQVASQIETMQRELLIINTETLSYQTRLKLLEETDKRHQDELRSLHSSQEVTKALVNQILSRFDSFEARLMGLFEQTQSSMLQAQNSMATERTTSQKEWMKLITYVIGATIGLIVAKFFVK